MRLRDDRGSAVVDFVLVVLVLVPLVLGVMQVALVLHVRNTLAAAASEGARLAATIDRDGADGAALARAQVDRAVAGRFAEDATATPVLVQGAPGWEVRLRATVPPLGLWGPGVQLEVAGHAIEEPGS